LFHGKADLFIQLTLAYNTLRDPIKRQEYDQSYKAKRDQLIRTQQMHAERRKAKEGQNQSFND
jgi:DnaJ-class molecular chaperone